MPHAYVLVGMYDSPYVRRVAISMRLLGLPYEHRPWSVFGDFEQVTTLNPLGRVPILVLDDDEILIESSTILDHLDEIAGADRALVPPGGRQRRTVLKRLAVALGACEKAVALLYERAKRASRFQDPDWMARLTSQLESALDWIERDLAERSESMDQAAITTAILWRFLEGCHPHVSERPNWPELAALSERLEKTAPFRAVPFPE